MQRRHVKLLIIAAFLLMLVILPNQVNAKAIDKYDQDESLEIVVIEASYMDYDDDDRDDDILTIFQIIIPEDDWDDDYEIEVSCAVMKPSGETLTFHFDFETKECVEITIVWFNFADEPGWYTLFVKAAADNDNVGPAYIEHEFDPPGGHDNGPPEIELISIKEL